MNFPWSKSRGFRANAVPISNGIGPPVEPVDLNADVAGLRATAGDRRAPGLIPVSRTIQEAVITDGILH